MATVIRTREESGEPVSDTQEELLRANVPKPFPSRQEREQLFHGNLTETRRQRDVMLEEREEFDEGLSRTEEASHTTSPELRDYSPEVVPSIAYVQKSCLMTLNTLLSTSTHWHPIVPDRRHSLPSSSQSPAAVEVNATHSLSALQTLVSNLRNRGGIQTMAEARDFGNNSELIRELQTHVDNLALVLPTSDAELARALVSLLAHFDRLSVIVSSTSSPQPAYSSSSSNVHEPPPMFDLFDTLRRQVTDLQIERMYSSDSLEAKLPPVLAVETGLLWSRIDLELDTVLSLCRQRTELAMHSPILDHLPPEYEAGDYKPEYPPRYDAESHSFTDYKVQEPTPPASSVGTVSEKMRMDLEAVAMAIDRLYLVAPQLHNQRVELKKSKLDQMERARLAGQSSTRASSAVRAGKEKERDIQELDTLLELLGKASDRRLADQSVILDGGMKQKMAEARRRDQVKREAFVEHLAKHSDAGRLHAQDAVRQPSKLKDPEALLTLPEFIRESVPRSPPQYADPTALLTLSEFFREPVTEEAVRPAMARLKSQKSARHRSLSSPPLSWLLSSTSKASTSSLETKTTKRPKTSGSGSRSFRSGSRSSRPASSSGRSSYTNANTNTNSAGLEINYIAEYHENLQHVIFLFTVSEPAANLEAEVFPSTSGTDGDRLILSYGSSTSSPLILPVPVIPGKKEVQVRGGHFEIKLPIYSRRSETMLGRDSQALMDGMQLSTASPTSFVCASCSLPLVQSARIKSYRDLPSEHWAELVEAWMCHSDQKMHDHVAIHARGIWPAVDQALVGGSYILFEDSAVVKNNLCATESKGNDGWKLVRCICGAVTGRCQMHHTEGSEPTTVYRLVKYAIRPVSPTSEPTRVPLSAFIVEDMVELVQAHATYRFVILDDEEERPRILIWLFKPSVRLAYKAPAHFLIAPTDSIHAAKVLFKILGPTSVPADLKNTLNKFPGFSQAENLRYPLDICRRLAGLLKESNISYPEGMRMMTGLDIGWLRRV